MLSDPLGVASTTFVFNSSVPAANETLLQGKFLNVLEVNGRNSLRSLNSTDLVALGLTKGELRIAHTPTNKGRLRSAMKMTTAKADASGVEHSVSVSLVIDQEQKPSAENSAALAKAIAAILILTTSGVGASSISTSSNLTDMLNGEM